MITCNMSHIIQGSGYIAINKQISPYPCESHILTVKADNKMISKYSYIIKNQIVANRIMGSLIQLLFLRMVKEDKINQVNI